MHVWDEFGEEAATAESRSVVADLDEAFTRASN
jgi:hypothetical protein